MAGRVWVVDDVSAVADSFSLLLTVKGLECRSVTTGYEAITLLANGNIPRAMVLDLLMPDVNGNDVLAFIKAHPEWTFPVIVITGISDSGIRPELRGRVFGVVRKGDDPALLVDLVGKALRE